MNFININMALLLKFITINICTGYLFLKSIDSNITKSSQKVFIIITSLILAIIQYLMQYHLPLILKIFLIYFTYSIVLSKLTQISISNSILAIAFSLPLSYSFTFISIFALLLFSKISKIYISNEFIMIFNLLISLFLVHMLFKIKRFKHGIPFIKNYSHRNDLNIFMFITSTIVLFAYFFYDFVRDISTMYITIVFVLSVLILFFILHKAFVFYQKQKLLMSTLKSYEQELSETKEKLAIAIEEKQKLIKSNHEFYHRQESLNKKLDDLMKQSKLSSNLNMNTEFAEDYSDILERINKLSDEYKAKTATIPNLEKTSITEIDDMLSYMQSECIKNNIEFNLKINCDVHYMIEKLISVSQLETLLGDLIRNSIIAINHSSKDFRSILVVFGMKDKIYELCVFDSGIPFEIDTLLNLGIKPASTHLDEGGSGIGFVTTFETMDSCNSSFVINEITNNNYTKSLEIKFDNLNEYIVVSDRKDEIAEKNTINKRNDIILK